MNSILVVDDEPDLRDIARQILEGEGYVVFEARDGTEALEVYRNHRCDLVLTDLVMEPMGGAELIKRLKQESPGAGIVVMTAFVDDILELTRLGILKILRKPFFAADLKATIREAMEVVRGRVTREGD